MISELMCAIARRKTLIPLKILIKDLSQMKIVDDDIAIESGL